VTARSILKYGTSEIGIARQAVEMLTEMLKADSDDRHTAFRLRQAERALAELDPKFAKQLASRPAVVLTFKPAAAKPAAKLKIEDEDEQEVEVVTTPTAAQRRAKKHARYLLWKKRIGREGMREIWRKQSACQPELRRAQARAGYRRRRDALTPAQREELHAYEREKAAKARAKLKRAKAA